MSSIEDELKNLGVWDCEMSDVSAYVRAKLTELGEEIKDGIWSEERQSSVKAEVALELIDAAVERMCKGEK